MILKLTTLFSIIILFSGCELLPSSNSAQITTSIPEIRPNCVWESPSVENHCRIEFWLQYWSQIEDIPWPERKEKIEILSEQEDDILKKVLLSQGKSTPYQDRLRAQRWVEIILPKLTQPMRRFITVALYYPSQGLLEMESALVTLSKINTHQSFNVEEQQTKLNEQQILLDKQQSQIDQLLNIEASIMESIEEDKE
jgi:hypothetical protein